MAGEILIFNVLQWYDHVYKLKEGPPGEVRPLEERVEKKWLPGRGRGREAYDLMIKKIKDHARKIGSGAVYLEEPIIRKDRALRYFSMARAYAHYYKTEEEQ